MQDSIRQVQRRRSSDASHLGTGRGGNPRTGLGFYDGQGMELMEVRRHLTPSPRLRKYFSSDGVVRVCRSAAAATTAQGHHGRYTFTFQGRLRIAKQFREGAVGHGDNGGFQSYTSLALQAAAVGQTGVADQRRSASKKFASGLRGWGVRSG